MMAPTALAAHHLRLFALIVDYLLAIVLLNLGDKLLLGAAWDLRPPPEPEQWRIGWWVGGAVLLLLRDALAGQSPGKWFTGIAVARADDPALPPTLAGRLLRNVTLPLLPVEAVLVFVDRYCRRLGDRLAGTVVVSQGHPAPVTRRLLGLTILFLLTTLAIFGAETWNVRRSAAYPLALRLAQEDARVAEAFGDDVTLSAPGLQRSVEGTAMQVRLEAESGRASGTVDVHLRLVGVPPHWEPERIALRTTGEPEAVPVGAPPVRDAPPR